MVVAVAPSQSLTLADRWARVSLTSDDHPERLGQPYPQHQSKKINKKKMPDLNLLRTRRPGSTPALGTARRP
uniref:Uncharacterized protein n=1 Tax=Arundo donax TaxID=35708 RepID=A0A0A9CXP1_ARUDO